MKRSVPSALLLLAATSFAATLAATLPLAATAFADAPQPADWPQWQSRLRDGMSAEQGLLKEWPADGPPLAWRVGDLGGGDSAPAVTQGRIFGMSIRGDEEVVWALSESDGKELWVKPLGPAVQQK